MTAHLAHAVPGTASSHGALHEDVEITGEASALVEDEELQPALAALLATVRRRVSVRRSSVSVVGYDDWSKVRLVKVEIEAGLTGDDAVQAEDDIADSLAEAFGDDTANRFLVVVG